MGGATTTSPVGVEENAAGLIHALVGVSAEIVALGLEEVGGKAPCAVGVEVGDRSADGRHGYSVSDRQNGNSPPAGLSILQLPAEEGIQQKVGQGGVGIEGVLDLAQELGSDDASSTPHEGDTSVVKLPAVLGVGGAHKGKALCVGHELGGVECVLQVIDCGLEMLTLIGAG